MDRKNTWILILVAGIALFAILASSSNFNFGNLLGSGSNNIITPITAASIQANYMDANGNVVIPYDYNKAMFTAVKPVSKFGIVTNTYSKNVYPVGDTWVVAPDGCSISANNYGSDPFLPTGRNTNTCGGTHNKFWSFWNFNLAGQIPTDGTITDYSLNLNYGSGASIEPASIHILSSPSFNEYTLTGNNAQWSSLIGGGTTTANPAHFSKSLFPSPYESLTPTSNLYLAVEGLTPVGGWIGYTSKEWATPPTTPSYMTIIYTQDTCVPETCTSLGKQCGSWGDTCGGTLNCGTPPSGYTCNSNGQLVPIIITANYSIIVQNGGSVTYTNVQITSTSPTPFKSHFPTTAFSLTSGQGNKWSSDNIDISSYHGQIFTAYVSAFNTYKNVTENFQSSITIP